jgi:methyl-accepting chemotaxis protein
LPLNHDIFNYLFEYKSIYLSAILLILFVTEYIDRKPDKILKVGILIAIIGFLFDTIIYSRTIRLSIYQLFNIILYLSLTYLVGFVIHDYAKTRSKASKDILLPMIILFISLTNDFVSFKYPYLIKNFYPKYVSLKYLNIYGFQFFVFLIAIKLIKDLVDSFFKLRILTKDLDKISFELEKRKEMLAENMQKLLDEIKESFLTSQNLSSSGNDFSKLIYNLVNQIDNMKQSLILSSENEKKITAKTDQLSIMLENVDEGFKKTSKILELVIEKINLIIENTNQIDTIVEQTSLLSLNSSVVAGKAKEKGKGFSIISEEIRKLSLKSANFSSNAHEGINNILKSVEEAKLRSSEFLSTFNKYLDQFNILKEFLEKNKQNHSLFILKINELIKIIDKISLLANEIDEKSSKLYAISNENMKI